MSEEVKTPPPAAAKPPAKPAGPVYTDITDDPVIEKLRVLFASSIIDAVELLGQQIITVSGQNAYEILQSLRHDPDSDFDFLTDLTAVHYPDKPAPFEVVYHLYSFPRHVRLRVKALLEDGQAIRSVTDLWGSADWMEREAYDLFGIHFDRHPDLRRILLPADWEGHPLRREHDLEYRENDWVRRHIEIRDVHPETDMTGKFEMTDFVKANR
jgi:NADH-quinone oxidoreductase subunit C